MVTSATVARGRSELMPTTTTGSRELYALILTAVTVARGLDALRLKTTTVSRERNDLYSIRRLSPADSMT